MKPKYRVVITTEYGEFVDNVFKKTHQRVEERASHRDRRLRHAHRDR